MEGTDGIESRDGFVSTEASEGADASEFATELRDSLLAWKGT